MIAITRNEKMNLKIEEVKEFNLKYKNEYIDLFENRILDGYIKKNNKFYDSK